MNDNDIIKALEVCAGIKGTCSVYDCPAFGRISDHRICAMRLKRECYDLISRQKAEIERLYKTLSAVQREQYINGRNDGIKEFEERLKEKAFYVQESEWDGYVVDCNDIIEFAKEMTEGEDGNV